jgi:hypothetical protein
MKEKDLNKKYKSLFKKIMKIIPRDMNESYEIPYEPTRSFDVTITANYDKTYVSVTIKDFSFGCFYLAYDSDGDHHATYGEGIYIIKLCPHSNEIKESCIQSFEKIFKILKFIVSMW